MKKKLLLTGMILSILAVALVGGTLAAKTAATNRNIYANLQTPTLQVELTSQAKADDTQVKPGDVIASNYAVKNPATNTNITEYVRVTVTKYWKDMNGEKVFDKDVGKIAMNFANQEDWLVLRQTSEQTVLVYKHPLAAGESTDVFLKSLTLDTKLGGYEKCRVGLDVTAEAVQYQKDNNELNAKAILGAWGTEATLDANGSITAVAQ